MKVSKLGIAAYLVVAYIMIFGAYFLGAGSACESGALPYLYGFIGMLSCAAATYIIVMKLLIDGVKNND